MSIKAITEYLEKSDEPLQNLSGICIFDDQAKGYIKSIVLKTVKPEHGMLDKVHSSAVYLIAQPPSPDNTGCFAEMNKIIESTPGVDDLTIKFSPVTYGGAKEDEHIYVAKIGVRFGNEKQIASRIITALTDAHMMPQPQAQEAFTKMTLPAIAMGGHGGAGGGIPRG